MEITIEAIEKVLEATGVEYKEAKNALVKTDGDVEEAIRIICRDNESVNDKIKRRMDKLKAKVKRGNVDRIQIRKDEGIVFSVPVNIGIIGSVIALATVPWTLIVGAVVAFGLGCRLEVVKKDGTIDVIDE